MPPTLMSIGADRKSVKRTICIWDKRIATPGRAMSRSSYNERKHASRIIWVSRSSTADRVPPHISKPTKTYAGSTWKSGFVITVPPTYISECRRSPRAVEALSNAMTRAEHPRLSSARSKRATMLCNAIRESLNRKRRASNRTFL
jgi:hypothetical protein